MCYAIFIIVKAAGYIPVPSVGRNTFLKNNKHNLPVPSTLQVNEMQFFLKKLNFLFKH